MRRLESRYVNTALQLFSGAVSFGIFLYLRAVMPSPEFHSVAVLFFAGSLATSLINLNLDRKYYALVTGLSLSRFFWLSFFVLKWASLSVIVFAAAYTLNVPIYWTGVVYFFGQTMTELYPKGFFEDQQAGPQSLIMACERLILLGIVLVDFRFYFVALLGIRGLSIALMWASVFNRPQSAPLRNWDPKAVSELAWNIRAYFPVGLLNTTMLQLPIWFGGLSADAKSISNLAVLRQSVLIPRHFSTIVTRLFHNWMRAPLPQFLQSALLVAAVSVALSISFFLVIGIAMGAEQVLGGSLIALHAGWSSQIVLVLFISKRMSLSGKDNHILHGAVFGLILSIAAFWSMKYAQVDLMEAYVLAIAVPHLLGVAMAWYLGQKNA